MEEITKDNCSGLCIQQFCDYKYTHFTIKTITHIECVLAFCKEHSEEFENNS